MKRAKKTQRIEDALFGSVSSRMPGHLREQCMEAFRHGRAQTLREQENMERTIKAIPAAPMPERDTPEWLDWWQRYHERSDVQDARSMARKRLQDYAVMQKEEAEMMEDAA